MSYRYAELVEKNVSDAPPLADGQLNKLALLFAIPGLAGDASSCSALQPLRRVEGVHGGG